MYERLIGSDKRMLLANTRMITAQLKNENIAESYINFLNQQAEDLKKEIEEMGKR